MKEGDIYFWEYIDTGDQSYEMAYWCRSRKAIVKNGTLWDTYWSDHTRNVPTENTTITFQGNIKDLEEIREYYIDYYKQDDVVDMRHPNSSNEKVYIKPGAKRCPIQMLELAKYRKEHYESNVRMAQQSVAQVDEIITRINQGDLDSFIIPLHN